MVDDVGRAEGRRKPILIAREIMGREADRAFAVLGGEFLDLAGDFVERLIPGDFFEFPFAALAHALQGLLDAQRMVPCPDRLCAAAAIAALRMVRIREDAHGLHRGLFALLLHREHAAARTAHAAGHRVRFPALGLETRDLFLGRSPGGSAEAARNSGHGGAAHERSPRELQAGVGGLFSGLLFHIESSLSRRTAPPIRDLRREASGPAIGGASARRVLDLFVITPSAAAPRMRVFCHPVSTVETFGVGT